MGEDQAFGLFAQSFVGGYAGHCLDVPLLRELKFLFSNTADYQESEAIVFAVLEYSVDDGICN